MANFYTPTKRQPSKKKLTVAVHSLDAFGQGVATHQGKMIFVKNALPGETVDIQLVEDKKQFAKAKVLKRHNTSTDRVTPQCQHYGICGGCQLQHISPLLQQQSKLTALLKLLQRETGQIIDESLATVVTASEYHYRRRARLAVFFDKKNQLVMGFRREASNEIISIEMCPVLVSELELLLVPLRQCLMSLNNKRFIGHIELLAVESGVVMVLRHMKPMVDQDLEKLKQFAEQYQLSLYLHGESLNGEQLVHLVGEGDPYYQIEDLTLAFSPLDFIQVNSQINQKMIAQALSWLALQPHDQVLDLFCGMGNFSLPMARLANTIVGIEGVNSLVEKAKFNTILNKNLTKNPLGHVEFYQQNLADLMQMPDWLSDEVNKVLLDPSRSGAQEITTQIAKKPLSHIVYISCNPATLVRDSKILLDAGYKIEKISILEMFPQTKHLESMVLFQR